jgi:hypothetical protein
MWQGLVLYNGAGPVENILKMRQNSNLPNKTTAYLLQFLNKSYVEVVCMMNTYRTVNRKFRQPSRKVLAEI